MPLDLSRIKGLCFDVDGTISDTDDDWVERIFHALAPVNKVFSGFERRRFSRWLVMTGESPMNLMMYWMDALSLDDNYARAFERFSRRAEKPSKPFLLMQGARELLDAARAAYPLTIVSARDAHTTITFLNQFELEKHFVKVVTSQTCERTKPYPHPIRHAAQAMGIEPHHCLMIGDTTVDILAGKRAGAQTVGVLCGFGTQRELVKAGADVVLNNLEELHALLFGVSPIAAR